MNKHAARILVTATRLALGALVAAATASAWGAGEDPFRLSAGLQDLPAYFPAYLANGFVSTLSSPRGTEATRAYMVALMDYTTGDVSRPAAVPGWTEIDFSSSVAPRNDWMNRQPMGARRFRDYQQTLDLHEGTLTTRYHYLDRGRDTGLEVTTFLSQASPHLGASRLTITPDYDGVVQLSFGLTLWAPHTPRFALAQLTGPEMEDAVAASGLTLQPQPPSTPDRAAVWYAGDVQVRASDGEVPSLSVWLDGRAAQGLDMAMAAAVALPAGMKAESVTLRHDPYRLALNVSVKVERGHSYTFTKYVAFSRQDWGGDAQADLALARAARDHGFERLLTEQRAAWDALWQSDIVIEGDPKAQQVAHSELYYLVSSLAPGSSWGTGPCGLTPCYSGHAFWDGDTWMFPALLLLHPQQARALVDFRSRTLDAAMQRSRGHGFEGAMYPWEADPQNGSEQTPHSAFALAQSEIHVTADVAIAQWQYYQATHDRDWLRTHGWPVIREVARFWTSRATWNAALHRYDIPHVNSVAESFNDIPNDTFTNVSAAKALNNATAAAKVLGEPADPQWSRVASLLYIPVSPDGAHHLAFDPAVGASGASDFGGGPLSLLFLPSLDMQMTPQLRRGDYDYAVRPALLTRVGAGSMNMMPRSTAASTVGAGADAAAWFAANFTGGTLKGPFNVRTETADNYVGYFMTGTGAYLQNLLYGFTGLRVREAGLVEAFPPVLPDTWKSLTLRNVMFRGQRMDIRVARDAAGAVRLTRQVH
jgi:protein-glucosylgalactosylhydroxylysine glucosidase